MAAIAQRAGNPSIPLSRVSSVEIVDGSSVPVVPVDLGERERSAVLKETEGAPDKVAELESTMALDRYLSDNSIHDAAAEARVAPKTGLNPAFNQTDPLRDYLPPRPQPIPAPDLVVTVAVVEAGLAAVAALFAAMLLLMDSTDASWPLALAMIAGLGSWLAYGLARDTSGNHQVAGAVLLASQLGILAWGMALVGPRVSLMLLVPGVLLVALRITGRAIAAMGAVLPLVIYGIFLWLGQPGVSLSSSGYAVLDVTLVISGVVLMLVNALNLHAVGSKALRMARIQRHELQQIRAHAQQERLQTEDEDAYLQEAMAAMLYGRDDWSSRLEKYTGSLRGTVQQVGERLAVLRDEREERQSLETAVHSLTRALERGWLGLPWAWPTPSGTSLDELVALLRTPNPREASLEDITNEAVRLVPIPSSDPSLTAPPWSMPTQHPRVRQHLSDPVWSFADVPADNPEHHTASGDVQSDPSLPSTRRVSPLPWLEWDEWRSWDERFSS
jgi:hypothetical protein